MGVGFGWVGMEGADVELSGLGSNRMDTVGSIGSCLPFWGRGDVCETKPSSSEVWPHAGVGHPACVGVVLTSHRFRKRFENQPIQTVQTIQTNPTKTVTNEKIPPKKDTNRQPVRPPCAGSTRSSRSHLRSVRIHTDPSGPFVPWPPQQRLKNPRQSYGSRR